MHERPHDTATLVDILDHRMRHQPDRPAYTFLLDGDAQEASLDYRALGLRVQAVAHVIRAAAVPGDRVVLVFPPGMDFIVSFYACLDAGVIAVPAFPPMPGRPIDRLVTTITKSEPKLLLATREIVQIARAVFAEHEELLLDRWVATDAIELPSELEPSRRRADLGAIAMLQFTSGSTTTPRGVAVTHGNLMHNLGIIAAAFGHTAESRGVIWLPPYHDMGLIGGILEPLHTGFPVTLMSPLRFLQKPQRWLSAISRYRATTSGGPHFAYELCLRKVDPADLPGLDLSSWTVAFNGAEPIRPDTLHRFRETFGPYGFRDEAFYPCYGLAESTLFVTGGDVRARPRARTFSATDLLANRVTPTDDDGAAALMACGDTFFDQRVIIVDPSTGTACEEGHIGEIWISGPSVARGYWQEPEETERVFGARLAGSNEGPFLRSGDLGFRHGAELFVVGRTRDLIIIRGQNHHPQDIERTLESSHAEVRPGCTAAFAIDDAREEHLVVVAEVRGTAPAPHQLSEIRAELRLAVTRDHGLQISDIVLVQAGSIPKTSSGKLQRHACRRAYIESTLAVLG